MLFVSSADKREYVRGNVIMACLLLCTTAAPPGGAEWTKHHTVIAQRLRSSSRSVTDNNRAYPSTRLVGAPLPVCPLRADTFSNSRRHNISQTPKI